MRFKVQYSCLFYPPKNWEVFGVVHPLTRTLPRNIMGMKPVLRVNIRLWYG